MMLLQTAEMLLLICCKVLSLEFLEKTTPYILRSPKLPLLVMAKSMEVSNVKFYHGTKTHLHLDKKILPLA